MCLKGLVLEKFNEIRPYTDEEISEVLERLLIDREFLGSIANFYYPRLTSLLPSLMNWLAKGKLRSQLRDVSDVSSMQDVIAKYMEKMIHDQLEESSAVNVLRHALFEAALLGTGVIKGPFTYEQSSHNWIKNPETGKNE